MVEGEKQETSNQKDLGGGGIHSGSEPTENGGFASQTADITNPHAIHEKHEHKHHQTEVEQLRSARNE